LRNSSNKRYKRSNIKDRNTGKIKDETDAIQLPIPKIENYDQDFPNILNTPIPKRENFDPYFPNMLITPVKKFEYNSQ
jgi:hypothetical protein